MSEIKRAKKLMEEEGLDGWLLYDFKNSNVLARNFLGLSPDVHLTRRFFYWIPKSGEPLKIVHSIDAIHVEHLEGDELLYTSLKELNRHLKEVVGKKRVAMEYSPNNDLPYISKVDAGTFEQVEACGGVVVSSANLLQHFTSILSEEQRKSHYYAAQVCQKVVQEAFDYVKGQIGLTEYDVALFINERFRKRGCVTDHLPIVAVNAHSAIPHYAPAEEGSAVIQKGDFLLIDLWCKQNVGGAIYADICRVGVIDRKPTKRELEIFDVVKEAQQAAIELIKSKKDLCGADVDCCARGVIVSRGYGPYFTHRTGHNIYEEVHGNGAHMDGFETNDTRRLLPNTCFSIEPGIYLPGEFGVRLETDLYIDDKGMPHITAGLQDHLD